MRVASDAIMKRAADVRRGGKSWLELTGTEGSRKATLAFFSGGGKTAPVGSTTPKR